MARAVGLLLLFELLAMSLSCIVSLLYGEGDWFSFAISMVVCALVGGGLFMYGCNISGRSRDIKLSRSESYIIVALSWVFFSIFGMLPYLVGGYIPSVTDAFFETMSGFTTTGATILDDIESLPHGILFWRSLTQWIGGLGIVCFTIALLPGFGSSSQMLFLSEATGVTHDKIHPRITVMARYIWTVYFALTAIEAVLLMIEGNGLFRCRMSLFHNHRHRRFLHEAGQYRLLELPGYRIHGDIVHASVRHQFLAISRSLERTLLAVDA